MTVDRREFLGLSAATALVVGVALPGCSKPGDPLQPDPEIEGEVNAWIVIAPDNTITIRIAKMEMGQGVLTALAMIVAEELECRWESVRTEIVDVGRNRRQARLYGNLLTDGSASVRGSRMRLQRAGANARMRLVRAAAELWKVKPADCRARDGVVTGPGGESADFGALAARAASIDVAPDDISIKSPRDFRLIGTPRARLDVADKTTGSARFGIDVTVPGLRVAAVRHSPIAGGRVSQVTPPDDVGNGEILQLGRSVFAIADNFWAAERLLDRAAIEWEAGADGSASTDALRRVQREVVEAPGPVASSTGTVAMDSEPDLVQIFEVPYLAHACLEPMNCTVAIDESSVNVWVGTQSPDLVLEAAAAITGYDVGRIRVHPCTMGGAFGRRISADIAREALELATATGHPIKLIWSREEDFHATHFRPMATIRIEAELASDGRPESMLIRSASESILAGYLPDRVQDGVDPTSVMGLTSTPYAIPNLRVETHTTTSPVTPWLYRSVGASQNVFAVESFIEECAIRAGADPLAFRRGLLAGADRFVRILDSLTAKRDALTAASADRSFGYAIHEYAGSVTAMLVQLRLTGPDSFWIDRVVVVADCGHVVNPRTVEEQLEGGALFGLCAALRGKMTLTEGRIDQDNFDTYEVLRIADCPVIDTYVEASGGEVWGGVGEISTPLLAPALCNALRTATGTRIASLPIGDHGLRLVRDGEA